jgi:NAD(P)-dependent dehydrogenase (short-subunit alcohol dehydrogenase family)
MNLIKEKSFRMSNFSKMHREDMTDHATSIGNIDVTQKADLEKLVKQIEEKEKCIHLLGKSLLLQQELMRLTLVIVANAGVGGPKAEPDKEDAGELKEKLWQNESVEEWNDTYSTDVTSVYFTTVAFLPLLQAAMEPKGPGEKFYMRKIQANRDSSQLQRSQGCDCPSDQADVCRVHEGRHQSQLNRSWILPQRNDSQELRRQTEERPPC